MSKGSRSGVYPHPIDMGGNRIESLGRSSEVDGAARIDDIADHVTLPSPNGPVPIPGVNVMSSPSDHVHQENASPTPTQVATTLFPAEKNPDDHGQCTTVIDLNSLASGQVGWAQVDGQAGVYVRSTVGALPASFFDGVTPTITPTGCSLVGKRFLNINEKVASPPYTPVTFRNGPYILDDVGDRLVPNVPGGTEYHHEYSFARFHRAPGYTEGSQFIKGMTFQIQTGNTYGTDFFTLETDQPITLGEGGTPQTWTHSEGPTHTWPNEDHLLCTSPELTTEDVSLDAQTVEGTIGGSASSATTNPIANPFVAASALGITSIPAEPFQIDIASVYVAGLNYDSTMTVGAQLWEVTPDGLSKVGAMIASGECTPLSNGTTTSIVFHATPSAVRSVSPTDKLMQLWTLHLKATSAQATITVRISYGAPWGTKITVPWQMSVTGVATGVHDQLDHRNFTKQHPNCSTHPVLSTSASVGWLWLGNGPANDRGVFDRSDYVRVTLQGDTYGDGVYGIKPTWQDGTAIPDGFLVGVYIANATPSTPKKAVSGATPPAGSGFLPLANDALPNGAGKQHTFNGPTELVYRLDLTEQRWRLVSFQTYAVVTP